MSIEANKSVVLDFFKKMSAGEIDAALALMADSATWWVSGKPDKFVMAGTRTKTQLTEQLRGLSDVMPNGVRMTPKAFTAEGDRVAVEAESYAETYSGKIYNNLYHFLFEVREGMIQVVREYSDTLHVKEVFLD